MDGGSVGANAANPGGGGLNSVPPMSPAAAMAGLSGDDLRNLAGQGGAGPAAGDRSNPQSRPATSQSTKQDTETAARKKFVSEMETKRSQAQVKAADTSKLVGKAMADGDIDKASSLQKEVLGYVREAQDLTIKIRIDPSSPPTVEEQEDIYATLIRTNRAEAEDYNAKADLRSIQINAKSKQFNKDDSSVISLQNDKKLYEYTSSLFKDLWKSQQEGYKMVAESYPKPNS